MRAKGSHIAYMLHLNSLNKNYVREYNIAKFYAKTGAESLYIYK